MVNENEFLLHALYMGIFITFLYDILRIFRRVIPHGKLAVSLEDIIFWIYCGIKVFLMMHHESNGTLRWFAVLGALTGMLLYKKLISPPFVKYVSGVLQKLVSVLVKVGSILFRPFLKIGEAIGKTVGSARQSAVRGRRMLGRGIKKKLTFLLKVLKMN